MKIGVIGSGDVARTLAGGLLMERLQHEFPAAQFVKAFNSVGNACMVNPSFVGGKPTMFICGNDEAAKRTVEAILDRFGWDTEDLGQVEAARAIEPLCMLWCIPGFVRNEWTHAFKLLRQTMGALTAATLAPERRP